MGFNYQQRAVGGITCDHKGCNEGINFESFVPTTFIKCMKKHMWNWIFINKKTFCMKHVDDAKKEVDRLKKVYADI
jgi:hypothetical protein